MPRTNVATLFTDPDVDAFRSDVMAIAAMKGVRIDTAVIALADILGYAAAKLDAEGDTHTLSERLHAFCARVEETYERVRSSQ